jgi:hypothetical protein
MNTGIGRVSEPDDGVTWPVGSDVVAAPELK